MQFFPEKEQSFSPAADSRTKKGFRDLKPFLFKNNDNR